MNMVDFGYFFALALIAMIAVVRGYPVIRRFRAKSGKDWPEDGFVLHDVAQSWSENELSVGRADSAPPRYI
jgi:hypothetical protein